MAKLIARAPLQFKGRDYRPGDTFEGNADDVVPPNAAEPAPEPDPAAERKAAEERRAKFEADEAERRRVMAGGTAAAEVKGKVK